MTESQWDRCARPQALLESLPAPVWARKKRLLACAFCRSIPGVVADAEFLRAIEAAERFADGECDASELRAREYDLADLVCDNRYGYHRRGLAPGVDRALLALTDTGGSVGWVGGVNARVVRPLLRCVFGNPLRPVILDRACLTPTAVSLARAAYEERHLPGGKLDPARLAVLADAMEEAGAEAELLEHLRRRGPHVRGCWVVDLVLGKK